MKKIIAKCKTHRHKFKRYAAVVAGAAIMAGTTFSGMPISKAAASEAPVISPPITAEQTTTVNKDQESSVKKFITNQTDSIKTSLNRGWHEHVDTWPSSGDTQGLYENGRIYYRNNNDRSDEYNNTLSNPVEFVKEYASLYGFDPDNDAFTLLSRSNNDATVQIIKNDSGQRFKVDLENRQGWRIVAVRGIADMNHSATFQSTRTGPY